MILSKEQILQAVDLPRELVAVPEWGGEVWVRGLTGAERDAFEASIVGEERGKDRLNLRNVRAQLVAMSVVDEAGGRLFTDRDVAALGLKSAVALSRIVEVCQRLSGLSSTDMEELAKN